MRFARLRASWRVLRGHADVVPVEAPDAPVDPLALRPDPTAHFNVYRVVRGHLMPDPEQYHGNDLTKAADALAAYRASSLPGTIYVTTGDVVRERV